MRRLLLSIVLCAAFGACGGSGDDSVDGPSSGDAVGADGARGADGGDVDAPASSDAVPRSPCPAEPPADVSICDEALDPDCAWLRCDAEGYVTATCEVSGWSVTTEACDPLPCGGGGSETCGVDQLCYQIGGGALLLECRDNPCGDGPIEAACACAGLSCEGGCNVYGRMVSCNTCPSGLCP